MSELPPVPDLPLAGRTVAVTAARRADELVGLLERRGATVVHAPALRTVPLEDDEQLRTATAALLDAPPDLVVTTTAVGFRGWLEAADAHGLGAGLRERLAAADVITRGPKVRGAVRAAGLREVWSPASEATEEVLAHLLEQGVSGRRIAVQLHGDPLTEVLTALRAAGAEVVEVPVYRWVAPEDPAPLHALVRRVAEHDLDAVTFTSAPAATSLLQTADADGRDVAAAFRSGVLAACVGPVTAAPLVAAGVPTVQPERFRLGDLVRTVVEALRPA